MTLKLNFSYKYKKKNTEDYVFFTNEDFQIINQSEIINNLKLKELEHFSKSIKKNDKNIIHYNLENGKKIILLKIIKDQKILSTEKLGADFYEYIFNNKLTSTLFFSENFQDKNMILGSFIRDFLIGLKLKSYIFLKYNTKFVDNFY